MGHFELREIELPNGKISYRSSGTGPAIFFLHGLGGGSKSWIYQLQMLQSDFTVFSWDAPGYGNSIRRSPDVDSYAQAAAEFIEALDLEEVTVVGHSMGGIIAGRLAGTRPALLDRLVLSSTFAGQSKPTGAPLAEGYRKRITELETLPADEFGRARAKSMTADSANQKAINIVAEIASEVNIGGYTDACTMINYADNHEVLPMINMPVLVLEAENDSIVSKEKGEELATLIPQAERKVLEIGGHAPYIEIPELYNQSLLEFISRHSSI